MTKYIDADALKEDFLHIGEYGIEWDAEGACHMINVFPAADVVEVVHGEWTKHGIGMHQWFCSVCEGKESAKRPYCPRCGARMDGKDGK